MKICTFNPCPIHKTLLNEGLVSDGRGRKILDMIFCQNNPGSVVQQKKQKSGWLRTQMEGFFGKK